MKVFHNSRDIEYRAPYGAIAPGTTVTLAVDVTDVADATVTLRTWQEGEGERRYEMSASAGTTRYQASITPEADGIVWYHFIITDGQGNTKRYGAIPGFVGGEGQLADWEPPSFQLTVHTPRDLPLAWHEPVGGYFRREGTQRTLEERIEAIRENYPVWAYETTYPWKEGTFEAAPAWSPWSALDGAAQADDAFPCFAVNDDVFGFWSRDEYGCSLCTLVNTSPFIAYDVDVPLISDEVSELADGYEVLVREDDNQKRFASPHLNPFGSCVLHFHATQRLQRPMDAGLGVLAHITSIPVDGEGPGTLGKPAKRFVDWLAEAGARYWQVLPANPTDDFGSPYAGISAFAGNVRLLEGNAGTSVAPRPYAKVAKLKKYQKFCERESAWLEPYVAFMAIRQKLGSNLSWQEWPERYRHFDPAVIAGDEELSRSAEGWRQVQYHFEEQWSELRAYANERGVLIVGDMPIYVSTNSADVWAHQDIFQLDENGIPASVAGCAPDAFSVDGQVWGNPLYDWGACRANGFDWWLRRLKRAFELYDVVRLDHFIGFSRYFAIPTGQKAVTGTYRRGPGIDFFQCAFEQLGPLPVIAEDLGIITPAVRDLGESCGFPGMDIVQFVDGNDPLSGYRPRPGKIAYTGTHDNQTLAGYCQQRYAHLDARETAERIMEGVATCSAPVCVIPLQDLMSLDDEARMNVPGTAEGNWVWQADARDLPRALEQARKLVALHEGR